MSGSLGSLVVELSANMAKFQSDMGKASHIAQQNMEKINSAVATAKKGLEALAAGLSIHAFADMIKSTIEVQDELGKMSQKLNISVENLSALKYSGALADVSLQQLGVGLGMLSKNMLLTEESSAKMINSTKALGAIPVGAAAAFKLLNISVEASIGHLKTSNQVFLEVADKFSKMTDRSLQTALAMQIFGKAGKDMIPLLNEGSAAIKAQREELARLGGLMTDEMVAASKEAKENMISLGFATDGLKRVLVNELVPGLNDITKAMVEAAKEGGVLTAIWVGLGGLASNIINGSEASQTKKHLDELTASIKTAQTQLAAGSLKPKGSSDKFFSFLIPDVKLSQAAIASIRKNIESMTRERDAIIKSMAPPAAKPKTDSADQDRMACILAGGKWENGKCGKMDTSGGVKDDPTKALLANQLKIYEEGVAKESALLATRNKFLDLYNNENLVSIKDYYAAKKSIQDEDVINTLALYDKEIAALKAYSAKADKATDRAEATGKINDLLAKKAKLEQSSMETGIVAGVQEAKAFHDLGNQIGSVNAQLFEFTGNLHAAAVIRFDQQNEALRIRLTTEHNKAALDQLDLAEKYTLARVDLNKLDEQSALIKGASANAEKRISIAQQAGAMTELGTLQAISAVRKKEADQLQTIYENYKQIADVSGNEKFKLDADNMKVALESLRAESDLVAQKFDTIFKDSFATAFEQFATGAKSAADAFKSFSQSVGAEISKLAAQQLSKDLFGNMFTPGSTSGGGGGDSGWAGAALSLLGGLFGGAPSSGSMFADQTAGFSAADLAAWGGPTRASGGPVNANSPYMVGERGPELFMPSGAGRIVPNHELSSNSSSGGGEGHTINVYISGSNNAPDVRRSASQGAREALAALNSAQRYA